MADDSAAPAPARFGDARTAAQAALGLLPVLPTPAGAPAARSGPSAPELAEPLRVFYVGRDTLARHEPGTDPLPLLRDAGELLYPVTSAGEVTAAVRVVRSDGRWAVKSVGEANLARAVAEVRASVAAATGTAASGHFLVHVPSLGQIFVGRLDAGRRLVLAPVHDAPAHGFVRARAHPGEPLLARLVPDARAARDAARGTDSPRG